MNCVNQGGGGGLPMTQRGRKAIHSASQPDTKLTATSDTLLYKLKEQKKEEKKKMQKITVLAKKDGDDDDGSVSQPRENGACIKIIRQRQR